MRLRCLLQKCAPLQRGVQASRRDGAGGGEEGEPNAGRADAGVAGGTSQAGLPRAAGSREAVYGDDVAGTVGRITVEGAMGVCVEVVRAVAR